MSETGERGGPEAVEELLRVNGELAAEIRSLRAGRIEAPRSAAMPAARRLASLIGERDRWQEEAERLGDQLRQVEAHNRELGAHIHELSREYDQLAARRTPLRRLGSRIAELARRASSLRG